MRKDRLKTGFRNFAAAFFLGAAAVLAFGGVDVKAESGAVYSCTINRSYSHPVTGAVEDSGGESSYATGQGMVEGCVYSTGLMEVTDSGNYYLTVRLGLMDYTSNQTFTVQNVGDSGWQSAGVAVTANGSDNNGTTADLCIQVPSENCIVRGSMYVTPMGRDVIFYFYPSDYTEGNSVGMTPAFVTETSAESTGGEQSAAESDAQAGTTDENSENAGASGTDAAGTDAGSTNIEGSSGTALSSNGLQVADAAAVSSDSDEELNDVQGLSLSTAEDVAASTEPITLSAAMKEILVISGSITISGLILLFAVSLVVWYFRKNWRRWGGEDDDDDEDY